MILDASCEPLKVLEGSQHPDEVKASCFCPVVMDCLGRMVVPAEKLDKKLYGFVGQVHEGVKLLSILCNSHGDFSVGEKHVHLKVE